MSVVSSSSGDHVGNVSETAVMRCPTEHTTELHVGIGDVGKHWLGQSKCLMNGKFLVDVFALQTNPQNVKSGPLKLNKENVGQISSRKHGKAQRRGMAAA